MFNNKKILILGLARSGFSAALTLYVQIRLIRKRMMNFIK